MWKGGEYSRHEGMAAVVVHKGKGAEACVREGVCVSGTRWTVRACG